ncbi:MAG: hypothetical protein MZU79_07510 [Anaerotruncus sp.]|nr:hypothetical protein [Anaerotruncus sp.]
MGGAAMSQARGRLRSKRSGGIYEGLERMAHASWRDEYGAASFPNFYRPAFLRYLFDRIPEDRRDHPARRPTRAARSSPSWPTCPRNSISRAGICGARLQLPPRRPEGISPAGPGPRDHPGRGRAEQDATATTSRS